jgi:uncharacterized protein YjbI with pentapeptide repeats
MPGNDSERRPLQWRSSRHRIALKLLQWLPSLHEPSPPHLWRIGYALAACFGTAALGLYLLWLLAFAIFHIPHAAAPVPTVTLHDRIGVAQLAFASVAGAGALVALVVAYRRQRVAEADSAGDRIRVFNERFTATAAQLGDSNAAVRLAGVHAMAGLADDWHENRQTCVDVLCAYLRIPYDSEPGSEAAAEKRLEFGASQQVRHTVIRVITAHLRDGADPTWQGLDLDFTGAAFDGGDFAGATFSGGMVRFDNALFSAGLVNFAGATFSGGRASFDNATFSGGRASFDNASFSGGRVSFDNAGFSGGTVSFDGAEFSGGSVTFSGATFSDGTVIFDNAVFRGSMVTFGPSIGFTSDLVRHGGRIEIGAAKFLGGKLSFTGANFVHGMVMFDGADFSGGTIDFSGVASWRQPPSFPSVTDPPTGLRLPEGAAAPGLRGPNKVRGWPGGASR